MLKFHRSSINNYIIIHTHTFISNDLCLTIYQQGFMFFSAHKTNFLFQIIDVIQFKPVRLKHIKSNISNIRLIKIIVIIKKIN